MSWPVMFFAAGLGTRMAPLTDDRPKPLIPVGGIALLDHALALAEGPEFHPKVVNLHYKGQMIRQHLAAHDVLYSDETAMLLDTGGGLRAALPLLRTGPVITVNTDAVWKGPNPLSQLITAWHEDMQALLLLVDPRRVHGHKGKGDFAIDPAGRLHRGGPMIYTGVQIIRTEILYEFSEDVFSLNRAWDIFAERGGLYGAVYPGEWCDVGQPDSIPLAEAMLGV